MLLLKEEGEALGCSIPVCRGVAGTRRKSGKRRRRKPPPGSVGDDLPESWPTRESSEVLPKGDAFSQLRAHVDCCCRCYLALRSHG